MAAFFDRGSGPNKMVTLNPRIVVRQSAPSSDQDWTPPESQGRWLQENGSSGRKPYETELPNPITGQGTLAGPTKLVRDNTPKTEEDRGFGPTIVNTRVRKLSDQEWAGLSPEQQQQVTANFALYNASLDDKKLQSESPAIDYQDQVKRIFGDTEQKGYAPNTLKVLEDLGVDPTQSKAQVNDFLSGAALSSFDEITGTASESRKGATALRTSLGTAPAFQSEGLQAAIASGQSLLAALANDGSVSSTIKQYAGVNNDPVNQLTPEQVQGLQNLGRDMASRSVWDMIQTDPAANAQMEANRNEVLAGIDPAIAKRYFAQTLPSILGTEPGGEYMNYDEFAANWLK